MKGKEVPAYLLKKGDVIINWGPSQIYQVIGTPCIANLDSDTIAIPLRKIWPKAEKSDFPNYTVSANYRFQVKTN